MTSLITLKAHFLAILKHEQTKRPFRTLDEWIEGERMVMLNEVNRLREKRLVGHIPVNMFIRMENTCLGHSDYSAKLALKCAELVLSDYVEINGHMT